MMCSRFRDILTVTDKFSELQQLRVEKFQNFELDLSRITIQYKTPPPTTTSKFMDIASGRGEETRTTEGTTGGFGFTSTIYVF